MTEDVRGFLLALLGSDTWVEAGAVWEGNPDQRHAARAMIAASPSPQHIGDAGGVNAITALLDAYDEQTTKLPLGHEMPTRGASTYNWRRSVVEELRALAALPPARVEAAPRVKPLGWDDMTGNGTRFRSYNGLMSYTISRIVQDEVAYFRWARSQGGWSDVFFDADACKAAAQADYEARILSALQSEQPK